MEAQGEGIGKKAIEDFEIPDPGGTRGLAEALELRPNASKEEIIRAYEDFLAKIKAEE